MKSDESEYVSHSGGKCPPNPEMEGCDSPLSPAIGDGIPETRFCYFCRFAIGPKRLEVSLKKKAKRMTGVLESMTDAVCHKCFVAFIPRKHKSVSDSSIRGRAEFAVESATLTPSLDAIVEGRGRLFQLDEEISRAIKKIKVVSAQRNRLLGIVLSLEQRTIERFQKQYLFRRKEANSIISDRAVRVFIFSRDHWKCAKCGTNKSLSIDHKLPVVKGGTDDFENLQTLCGRCNSSKGTKADPQFVKP